MRIPAFVFVSLLAITTCVAETTAPAGALPARYRDFKVYAVSEPDAKDPTHIVATVQFRNEGDKPLDISATLPAEPQLGYAGGTFKQTLAPGAKADWTLDLHPVENFRAAVLKGEVKFGSVRDRDLYVAFTGKDLDDFKAQRVEKVTARAQATATYAPRTLESIRASMKAVELPADRKMVTIAKDGKSDYEIVITDISPPDTFQTWIDSPDPIIRDRAQAVLTLQRVIKIQSGALLEIVRGQPSPGKHGIFVGEAGSLPADGRPEPYRIRVKPDGAIIVDGDFGFLHAVYGLVTDHLGVRWFTPTQLGEEIPIPADKAVSLPADLDETRSPSFFSSGGMSWSDAPLWDRRNRAVINRGRMVFGHSWQKYLTPAEYPFDKFPDMWARDRQGKVLDFEEQGRGWSATNFCSTSPAVIDIVAKKINTAFDADPSLIVMSLDPNDYAPLCQCDRCLALDKKYGVTREDGKHAADRLIHFSNEIEARLKPEHKGKFLGFLMYGYQIDPPVSAKPHDHAAGLICQFPARFDHSRPFTDPTSKKARRFNSLVTRWGSLLAQMGFYDYYGHYYFFGPYGIVHKIREDLPAFRDAGGTFVMIEAQPNWGMDGLNLYIAAQLVWNINADVDVLLEDYFEKFYGPAAEPMREFWLTAERKFALERPGADTSRRVAREPGFWDEQEAWLKKAEQLAAAPGVAPRFKERVQLNRDGFDLGRKMFEAEEKYLPRGGEPDFAGAIKELEANQTWMAQLKAKYAGGDAGKYPTLLARYFWPSLDEVKQAQAAQADAKKHPQPAPVAEDAEDDQNFEWMTRAKLDEYEVTRKK